MGLRNELEDFAGLQEAVLQDSDAQKGSDGWKGVSNTYLFSLLKLEIKELEDALIDGHPNCIRHECADIANYAMMIADNNKGI